jgi:hypothetical protein
MTELPQRVREEYPKAKSFFIPHGSDPVEMPEQGLIVYAHHEYVDNVYGTRLWYVATEDFEQ